MKNFLFRGVGTALVTPFLGDNLDLSAFGRLIDFQKEYADALIVAGTTGEAPTLSARERDTLLSFAIERKGNSLPIIMGTGSNDTKEAIARTRRAAELGADGALVVAPYYNRGTTEGVRRHFLSIAEASPIPLILYNVPARTGGSLTLADYEALLPHPNILGVKESEESTEKFFLLTERYGETCAIYTGSDSFLLPSLALGGDGVISVVSNLFPGTLHAVIRASLSGDLTRARRYFADLFPLCRLLFAETSPAPVKEALRLLGFGNGESRLPLTPPTPSLCAALSAEISRLSALGLS